MDQSFPVPEPPLTYNSSTFDGWFGIPLTYSLHTTHMRVQRYSENLSLYNLSDLIPL